MDRTMQAVMFESELRKTKKKHFIFNTNFQQHTKWTA